ncbi:MAG: DMT family transporter [Anaerolineae bacterium]
MNTQTSQRPAIPPIVGIIIGIIAVSFAAIFVRYASLGGAPALAIAAWRMILASLILALPASFRAKGELRALDRRVAFLAVLSGIFLAVHFATWITSLQLTSIASSAALVSTYPLFAAIASTLWLKERLQLIGWVGVIVAVVGSAVIALGDVSGGTANSVLGDMLALAAAVAGAGYFLLGRSVRQSLSLLAYISLSYSTAAIVLLVVALVTQTPLLGYSPAVYFMLLLLAIVPQLIGHSAFNWALGYLSATFVTVTVVGEPIGATILAFVLFGERPGVATIVGGAMILVGIVLVSRAELGARRQLTPVEVEAASDAGVG